MIGNCKTRGQNIGFKGLPTDSLPFTSVSSRFFHLFPNREPVHRLTQATLDPESRKHLLVVSSIAIDHIFKTVSQFLSLGPFRVLIVFKSSQLNIYGINYLSY